MTIKERISSMFELKWIYELILFIYCLSLIGYFIDFIKSNWKINRIAFWSLTLVWVIQTAFLYNQVFIIKNFPILTLNDGLFFYAWVLLTFSLIMNHLFTIHFIVLFTNIFSFFILLLSTILNAQQQGYDQVAPFIHEVLIIHITLTIVSYGFFTISFLLALMYLLQYWFLKEKKGLRWMWRFADLRQLDAYSFLAVVIGVPLLLIGLLLGFVWAYVSGDEFYWYDLKTIGSLILFILYVLYLVLRVTVGYQGKRISIYNTVAFTILLLNLLLFGGLSNFHF